MGNSEDEAAVQLARLEVKLDSVLEELRREREATRSVYTDHEERLRRFETLGDPQKVLLDIHQRLEMHELHARKVDRWIHSIPVGTAIAFVIAVGGLISYVHGITP